MAAIPLLSQTILVGTTWSAPATAPGLGAGVTVAGTISSSTDISAFVRSITVDISADELDWTNFASGGSRQKMSGLEAGTITIELNQDYAASATHALFRPGGTIGYQKGQTTPYYLDLKPTSSARGATNPSFVCAFLNNTFNLGGSVGELGAQSFQFPITGIWAFLTA